MKATCPHCQRVITRPAAADGEVILCYLCQKTFPLPSVRDECPTGPFLAWFVETFKRSLLHLAGSITVMVVIVVLAIAVGKLFPDLETNESLAPIVGKFFLAGMAAAIVMTILDQFYIWTR